MGALIYWSGGSFRKDLYRHIKIRSVEGVDDYAMMRETVQKILINLNDALPNIVVIDGGKDSSKRQKEL